MNAAIHRIVVLFATCSLTGCAAIFDSATCNAPLGRSAPQALVSVFVVPFEANSSSPIAGRAAEESARLIKVESIKANADGDFTGVTLLSRGLFEQPCDAQQVIAAIQGGANASSSNSLVVWGLVVKRDDLLASQLYSRIVWHDDDQRMFKLRLDGASGRTLEFAAPFPDLTVAFPQKTIGSDVNGVLLVDKETLAIPRARPSFTAVAADLPASFSIGVHEHGWVQLVADGGKEVWLNLAPVKDANGERLFPETDYFYAASAFVKEQHVGSSEPATKAKLAKLLKNYEAQYGAATELESRTVLAVVHLMVAFQDYADARTADDDMSAQATKHILAAASLLPGNAEIANLAALAAMGDCCSGHADAPARAARVQDHFDRALQRDPANLSLLRNLDKWYALIEQRGITPSGMARDDLRARHRDVRARLRADD
jgi:hypothetical protein